MPTNPQLPEKRLTDAEVRHITEHFWWEMQHERPLLHAQVMHDAELRDWFLMKLYKTADAYKVRYMPHNADYSEDET